MLRPTAGGIGGFIYWSREDIDRWSRESETERRMAEESESPFAAAKRLHAAAKVLSLKTDRFPAKRFPSPS